MSIDARGVLRWPDENLAGMFKHPDGRPFTGLEVRAQLVCLIAAGHEYVQYRGCDNFDPKRGCMGHNTEKSDGR